MQNKNNLATLLNDMAVDWSSVYCIETIQHVQLHYKYLGTGAVCGNVFVRSV